MGHEIFEHRIIHPFWYVESNRYVLERVFIPELT